MAGRTVRVLVDVTGIRKEFDYLVGDADRVRVRVGTEVRVRLGARRVRGWVVECDVAAPPGVELQPILGVRGVGPSAEVIDLARWAARRWAGHPAQLLRVASAPTVVHGVGRPRVRHPVEPVGDGADPHGLVDRACTGPGSVVRLPPASDRIPFIVASLTRALAGDDPRSAVVACPTHRAASRLVATLRGAGLPVAALSADGPDSVRAEAWARATAGGHVAVGTRNVAWAPAPDPALFIVVDEHDEAYQSTRTPTWHARDVLVERARRAGVPCILLSPCPSLDAIAAFPLLAPPRAVERQGWPHVDVIDRRDEDPRTASSLFSERLGAVLDRSGRTVCVLNRTGRVRLLACRTCGALTRCDACGAAVHAARDADLVCPRCGSRRPRVCAECGSSALKNLRIGVSRAREELEALIGEPVAEVTGDRVDDVGDPRAARVVIGTEAALYGIGRVDTAVFLDIDQELTAPRFRAAEQAMTLLARAARLVGDRRSGRRIVVQTRLPDHPVLVAAGDGAPAELVASESELRQMLVFPPFTALALVSGAGAPAFVEGVPPGRVDVLDGGDGTWLLRAPDHTVLADTLAQVPRPPERLRVEVDPLRV